MKKRFAGLVLGLVASLTILLITAGVSALLAITIIGIPFAILVAVAGSLLALAAPVVGFISPDQLQTKMKQRKLMKSHA